MECGMAPTRPPLHADEVPANRRVETGKPRAPGFRLPRPDPAGSAAESQQNRGRRLLRAGAGWSQQQQGHERTLKVRGQLDI